MVDVVDAASREAIERAADLLTTGAVVVLPTDTVYGVGVDPFVPGATDRLFAAKQRPRDLALPVLIGKPRDVERVAVVSASAWALIDRHWPGGLTIVLPRTPALACDLGAEDATVGVRCPDNDVVRELCGRVGPLAVTSANLHGEPTPDTAAGVAAMLDGAVALVLDGGPCVGSPSTVVDCTVDPPRVLREGAVRLDR